MSDESELRGKLIRLAHENPALREELLPLLGKTSSINQGQLDELLGEMSEGFATSKAQIWQGVIDTMLDGEEDVADIERMIKQAQNEVVDMVESTAKAARDYLRRKT